MSAPSHAKREAGVNSGLDPDQLEVAPGAARESIEGWVTDLASEQELRSALEKAFDYRGDVTITHRDGTKVEGYVFDRIHGANLASSFVRILPRESSERVKISYADIRALVFSGRDTAAGKSWDAWVRKYWAKRATGEGQASLQPESLD
jgi:hypothetical protein